MSCKLCNKVIISNSVTFTSGTLVINVPAGCYLDDSEHCLIVNQTVPSTATINAPVVLTIGSGTIQYPILNRDCTPCTASQISPRMKYKLRTDTSTTSAVFKLCNEICCIDRDLVSVNGTAPVATTDES
jgi:hypothetical protein